MLAEVGIVIALADQLDEGVDRYERVLDLVGDPGDDACQELRLLRLAPLRRELLLRRQVLEDEDGTERERVGAADGVGRDLEP